MTPAISFSPVSRNKVSEMSMDAPFHGGSTMTMTPSTAAPNPAAGYKYCCHLTALSSQQFIASVSDTAEKLFTGVNDTTDKFFTCVANVSSPTPEFENQAKIQSISVKCTQLSF
jgi:hypothetical protein